MSAVVWECPACKQQIEMFIPLIGAPGHRCPKRRRRWVQWTLLGRVPK